jgi:hypothetical protein
LLRLEHGGGDPPPHRPQVVVVKGGLPKIMIATLPELAEQLDAHPGESFDLFRLRAVAWAIERGVASVVITGVPSER